MKLRILHLFGVIALFMAVALLPGTSYSADGKIWLDIENGDTAFMLDKAANKAWWVVGECRRPIPLQATASQSGKSKSGASGYVKSVNIFSSKIIRDNVNIGSHQMILKQQFRFNLENSGHIRVEVYNSLRNGWSEIPVRINPNCAFDTICQSRMEAPEC